MNVASLALIGMGLMAIGAEVAHADCADVGWIGTADGTKVPTRGSLYVHDEALAYGEPTDSIDGFVQLTWTDGTGTATVSRVNERVVRVDYAGSAGAVLTVHRVAGWEDDNTRVHLTEGWQAPAETPRVLQYWHHADEWTCSYSDSLMIQIDQPTAALRAHWTIHGRAVDYIEPARVDGTKAALEIGKINCGGENFPVEQLKDGEGELELFAIRFDGTEVPVRKAPRRVRLDKLPPSDLGLQSAFTIVDAREEPASARAPAVDETGTLGLWVLGTSALGVLVGFVLLRRVERSESGCSLASE